MNEYKKLIEELGEGNSLNLRDKELDESNMKFLAEALRHSRVNCLSLSHSKIEDNGMKHLADALKDTQIKQLYLSNSHLTDEGVKYLADALHSTKIERLDLTGNKISFGTAEYLNGLINDTNVNGLRLDVYNVHGGICILQQSDCKLDDVRLELINTSIGSAGSSYINNSFRERGIREIKLNFYRCTNNYHFENLFQVFKNVKIRMLCLSRLNSVEYLLEIFGGSQIGCLHLHRSEVNYNRNIDCLARFLRKTIVLDLDIDAHDLDDESMRILAPALKNTMSINLRGTALTSRGIKYLSDILRDSKIVYINLCNSEIGTDGARQLANGLPHSQVTGIHLHGNNIGYEGYQAILNIVEDTNLSWINLHYNDIEKKLGLKFGDMPFDLPRKTITIARKIEIAFKGLVSLDPNSHEFEFIVPKKDCDPPMNVNQYAFLIETLKKDPNSKVHIIYNSSSGCGYDFNRINQIEHFIANIINKFISFIDNKLSDLVVDFADDDYIGLVKLCEELKLADVVQNLLLHRILYYVDDNQEILHPYIYKLLNKYNLPMYNAELEPNKKSEIISYFEEHLEIDGAQEIIDLLKSSSV